MTPNDALTQSWSHLITSLNEFGICALEQEDALDSAEGIRHSLRFLGHLADYHIERADPLRPEFWSVMSHTRKFYGDGIDMDYDLAIISGQETYHIRGKLGTNPYLAFIVYRHGAHRFQGNIVIDKSMVNENGDFELMIGPNIGSALGIETDDKCIEIVARQYFNDRDDETPATYTIERVGPPVGPREPLDPMGLASSLDRIGHALSVAQRRLIASAQRLAQSPNEVHVETGTGSSHFFGTTSNTYQWGRWRLGEDQTLQLHIPAVSSVYLGVQLFNLWMESLEYRDHAVSLNKSEMKPEDDGSFVVNIGEVPRGHNDLETCGHREGIVLVRILEAEGEVPATAARVL